MTKITHSEGPLRESDLSRIRIFLNDNLVFTLDMVQIVAIFPNKQPRGYLKICGIKGFEVEREIAQAIATLLDDIYHRAEKQCEE